jgi:hypothetical protein
LKISDKRIPQVSKANLVVNYTSKDYYWTGKGIFPCRRFPNRDNAATVRHFKNGATTRTVAIVIPPTKAGGIEIRSLLGTSKTLLLAQHIATRILVFDKSFQL